MASNNKITDEESEDYDVPDSYENLDEVAAPGPIQNPQELSLYRTTSLESRQSGHDKESEVEHEWRRQSNLEQRQSKEHERRRAVVEGPEGGLTEVAGPPPLAYEGQYPSAEDQSGQDEALEAQEGGPERQHKISRFATQLYTISYLIFFSFLGTLARLGLQALTFYPGAPATTGVLWANFGGSLIMGFLSEDRQLFREEWGERLISLEQEKRKRSDDGESQPQSQSPPVPSSISSTTERKSHARIKKTIPLYIGLSTGFCGSFTSFSSFIRDMFLALSNNLPSPINHPSLPDTSITSTVSRKNGYSVCAALAVLLMTVSLSLSGLVIGAHLAVFSRPIIPTLPFKFTRKILDRLTVFLSFGCWLGAILLAIWPPDRPGGTLPNHPTWASSKWRGEALFALVFAPLGVLFRFQISILLNPRIPSFPLGTFAANIFGTLVLGMCYDLQHVPLGGRIGCQVLQGVMDGFCGCTTTVSTWVAELESLKRKHSYFYGGVSVGVGFGCLVVVMGALRWTEGFEKVACVT
ncbi:MAG: hypothetical protein M1834_001074 [Cirrosporium novae-zelandiae]|nr:MAG: hypothetical protein M1834_001074 [Cirrosporium novae-zelandiae]